MEIWSVDLERPAIPLAELERVLSDEERERARRFLDPVNGERYRAAHGALRLILARYADTPAEQLELRPREGGKPELAGGGPHFSLSHSGELALVAVCAACPVGVDVERVSDDRDVERVARRAFGPRERAPLEAASGAARRELFFRLWTCKEACLKVGGRGISGLEDIEVTLGPDDSLSARDSAGELAVAPLEPADGYAGAVAVRAADLAVAVRAFTGD